MTAPQDPFSTPPQGGPVDTPSGYGAPGYGEQASGFGQPRPFGAPAGHVPPRNGFGVAALVLGILSLFSWFLFVGGLLGLLAIILGVLGRKRARRGEATNGGLALAGIITGALGLLLTLLAIAGIAALFGSDSGRDFIECVNEATSAAEQAECETEFGETISG